MSTAYATNIVWEARSATGNDNNGGGYVPGSSGTDFTQQASAQYALTGLASAGSGDTILSAAAANDMVGNVANAISGTNITVGSFVVVSVSVGVSITFSLNKGGASICTGVAASAVINIGGAKADWLTCYQQAGNNNRHIIWAKGTFGKSSAADLNVGDQLDVRGYGTVRGDQTKATFTTATNSTKLIHDHSGWYKYTDIAFTTTAGTPAQAIFADGGDVPRYKVLTRCSFSGGFTIAIDCYNANSTTTIYLFMEDCTIDGCTNVGIQWSVWENRMFLKGCIIKNCTNDAILIQSSPFGSVPCMLTAIDTVFYNNGGSGVYNQLNTSAVGSHLAQCFDGCVFANNAGWGLKNDHGGSDYGQIINVYNCIFQDNTTGAITVGTSVDGPSAYGGHSNAYKGNTNTNYPAQPGDVTYTVDCFVTIGTDWHLNGTAGGGASLAGAGFQSSILG